jgi:hypothetical protein
MAAAVTPGHINRSASLNADIKSQCLRHPPFNSGQSKTFITTAKEVPDLRTRHTVFGDQRKSLVI